MISPANTLTFVTRSGWGMSPEELKELYPSGERNFVRIATADHFQAPALVEAAKDLGARRVAVLWDRGDSYVAGQAADMRERAEALGLELVDSAAWNPYAGSFDRLARRVAATRPDAVLLAGAAPPHVDSLLADLHSSLGRDVALIAREGFIHEPSPAARGLYVGYGGIPNAELPPAGLQFLEELKASGGEPGPDLSAVYGAQAAEILLDAIARSDGTRASVTRELFHTRIEDGILGDISFDRYGDLVEGPVTVYRVTRKGLVFDRVIIVGASTS
jgi:branched-chain amino acid transport system substrate-binding protein